MAEKKHLRLVLIVDYEVDPDDYDEVGGDAFKMAELDLDHDAAGTILNSDWTLESAVLR